MINHTKINIKKINENAILPSYGTEYAAGADLYACLDKAIVVAPGKTEFIGTGLSLEIPEGFVGLIYARSGLACKKGLAPANKVGVIDSDYRGEIIVALYNHSDNEITVNSNDRIAQIVITPYIHADFCETSSLSDTLRSSSGFGSTGK